MSEKLISKEDAIDAINGMLDDNGYVIAKRKSDFDKLNSTEQE